MLSSNNIFVVLSFNASHSHLLKWKIVQMCNTSKHQENNSLLGIEENKKKNVSSPTVVGWRCLRNENWNFFLYCSDFFMPFSFFLDFGLPTVESSSSYQMLKSRKKSFINPIHRGQQLAESTKSSAVCSKAGQQRNKIDDHDTKNVERWNQFPRE